MSQGLEQIFNTMTSAMSAQSVRMNIIASNLANASSEGGSEATTYRAKYPVFEEVQNQVSGASSEQSVSGVRVASITQSKKPLQFRIDPDNPVAGEGGRVYSTDVNMIQEMTDMVAASREYESSVEAMNTIKHIILKSINALKD